MRNVNQKGAKRTRAAASLAAAKADLIYASLMHPQGLMGPVLL